METEHKVIGSITVLTLGILIGVVWLSTKKDAREQIKLSTPLVGEVIVDPRINHVADGTIVDYKSNPPTTGPHYNRTSVAGMYDTPVPDGNLIHSMEHGAVILWYKSSLSKEQVDQLKQIYNSVKVSKKIMVPRENFGDTSDTLSDTLVALTSWERLLKLQTIDAVKIKEFMEINEDRGPEKAPL